MGRPSALVWGTGNIGMRHLELLKKRLQVHAVALPKHSNREGWVRRHGFTAVRHLSDTQDMGIRHVIITSRSGEHWKDLRLAQSMGFSVLLEKPVAVSCAEVTSRDRMRLRRNGNAWTTYVWRFSKSLHKFKQLLPKLGRVHRVESVCRSYLPDWRPQRPYRQTYSAKAGEGGVLLELTHDLDYTTWLFGRPKTLWARLRNTGRLGIAAEEMADLSWESRGAHISVSLDYLTRPPERSMHAYGEKGSLRWDGLAQRVTWNPRAGRASSWTSRESVEELRTKLDHAFLEAQHTRYDRRLVTVPEALETVAICDAARLSNRRRAEVAVSYGR